MLQMRRSRLFAELRTYFESGRGCFAKASTVVIMRACSSTVEQGTHNPLVLGSNPGGPTKTPGQECIAFDLFLYWERIGKSLYDDMMHAPFRRISCAVLILMASCFCV